MDANGSGARQITKESFRLLNNPVWHPSGRYVAGRKHFTTRRSLGTGEIWLYSLDGGDGVQLVKRPSDEFQKELGEPAFSPDGKYLYYTQNITPGHRLRVRAGREQGRVRHPSLRTGQGRNRRCRERARRRGTPDALSRWPLARVRASPAHAERVRDGAVPQGPAYRARSGRSTRTSTATCRKPGPSTASIRTWTGCPTARASCSGPAAASSASTSHPARCSDIPFHVKDTRASIAPPRFDVAVAPDEVQSRMVRFASVSPDGKHVVFESFGRLWLRNVADGAAAPPHAR